MWEYKKSSLEFRNNIDLTEFLNNEGRNDWEIIFYEEKKTTEFSRYYMVNVLFKRQKLSTITNEVPNH